MKKWYLVIASLGLTFGLAACGDNNNESGTEKNEDDTNIVEDITEDIEEPAEESTEEVADSVTVDLLDTNGDSVGQAELSEDEKGVTVKVEAEGLPAGPHGFHFHETGKCDLPDFESAGGHFNPAEVEHGLDNENGPHAGDLPNLEAAEDGTVNEEFLAETVTLKKNEENSLFKEGGTALVIHADEDDGKTQPSGESGDRIVCGVIE